MRERSSYVKVACLFIAALLIFSPVSSYSQGLQGEINRYQDKYRQAGDYPLVQKSLLEQENKLLRKQANRLKNDLKDIKAELNALKSLLGVRETRVVVEPVVQEIVETTVGLAPSLEQENARIKGLLTQSQDELISILKENQQRESELRKYKKRIKSLGDQVDYFRSRVVEKDQEVIATGLTGKERQQYLD